MEAAGRLATWLDVEMLARRGVEVASASTPLQSLAPKTGAAVTRELGGRYLLRYLRPGQERRWNEITSGGFLAGDQYVTPTPFEPSEAVQALALPNPGELPLFVVLIKPEALTGQVDGRPIHLLGPRWVRMGHGIEYLVQGGIPIRAIVEVGTGPQTKWPLRVR